MPSFFVVLRSCRCRAQVSWVLHRGLLICKRLYRKYSTKYLHTPDQQIVPQLEIYVLFVATRRGCVLVCYVVMGYEHENGCEHYVRTIVEAIIILAPLTKRK